MWQNMWGSNQAPSHGGANTRGQHGWHEIPTKSSAPKTHTNALSKEGVTAIIKKRMEHRRCGQVVHHELKKEGVQVSLSSVQRTLERTHLLKERSPWKRPHDYTERPE